MRTGMPHTFCLARRFGHATHYTASLTRLYEDSAGVEYYYQSPMARQTC
jgi:hypothetical protein